MQRKIVIVAVIAFSIVSGIILGVMQVTHNQYSKSIGNKEIENIDSTTENITNSDAIVAPPIAPLKVEATEVIKTDTKIKAIYLTGWSAGSSSKRTDTINSLKENGFNGVVIDIKDEAGRLSYNSNVQTAIDMKASQGMIADIKAMIQEFHDNNIYVIGRIVTFKDPLYAKNNPSIAYTYADGTIWKDYAGNNWPNPYNYASWDYPIALAKEAATIGFDEIQFDYIRFPSSEGKVKQISFRFDSDTKTKSDIIAEFLNKVMDELKEYNVLVSGDVFGITTKKAGDFENIGQDFARIAQIVDVICPMVYPSHYANNEYNIAKPDKNPYAIIIGSLRDAQKRISEIDGAKENIAIIRPYLQDFTASWLGSGNYLKYNTNEVKDQIQACFDLRIDEFILWDPSNKYCYEALEQAVWISEEEYQAKLLEEQKKIEEQKKLEEQPKNEEM